MVPLGSSNVVGIGVERVRNVKNIKTIVQDRSVSIYTCINVSRRRFELQPPAIPTIPKPSSRFTIAEAFAWKPTALFIH